MRFTNLAPATRGLNVKFGKDRARTLVLEPGQTSDDVTLADPEDPMVIGMLQTREMETDDDKLTKRAREQIAPRVAISAMPYAETREAVAPEQVPELRPTIPGKPAPNQPNQK